MHKPTIRRLIAYIIDVIVISIIVGAISKVKAFNPYTEKLDDVTQEYTEVIGSIGKDPNVTINNDEITDLVYRVTYYSGYVNIYTLVLTAVYFIGFQYFTKGKTLGRVIMKIELVSTDSENLRISQLFKRSMIINSLITSPILIVMLFKLSKGDYLAYSKYIQLIDYGLIIASLAFVIYREDGVGLHDLFAHTRVIMSSDKNKFYASNDTKEEVKEVEKVENETMVKPKTSNKSKKVRDAKIVKEKTKKEK